MLTCTVESGMNKSFLIRAHIEVSVMGYNPVPRRFDTVALSGQLSAMVLLCCFVHYVVSRVLRRSNLDARRALEYSLESDETSQIDCFDSFKPSSKDSESRDSREREGGGFEYSENLHEKDMTETEQDEKDRELAEDLQRERETVAALYSELEQERNCSATAASEAMAMISRLQEEKAAVQMEARQFERMVVEKAMYDQEAIEALNELLVSREQEKLALEEEIRVCKEKLDALVRENRRQSLVRKPLSKVELPLSKVERSARDQQQSKCVDKLCTSSSTLLTALVQDGGRGVESQLGRRLSNGIKKTTSQILDTDVRNSRPEKLKVAPKPEKLKVAPKPGREEQIKYVDVSPQPSSTNVRDGGRVAESQVLPRPLNGTGIARKGVKSQKADDTKSELPRFVSLERRWGSQEITLKTLEQAKEERRVEDKSRGSVLEFVKKFERQRQHGTQNPVQVPSVSKQSRGSGELRSRNLRGDGVDDKTAIVVDAQMPSVLTRTRSLQGRGALADENHGEDRLGNSLSRVGRGRVPT